MDPFNPTGTKKIKVERVQHSTGTNITDISAIIMLLIITFFSQCTVNNYIPCGIGSGLVIILILVKYFIKIEEVTTE